MASTSEAPARASRGLLCWALFEWARNPYVLVITIYIYATYFTRDIIGDPVRGQALWAAIQGYAGIGIAVLAPFLGAVADAALRQTASERAARAALSVPANPQGEKKK